MATLLDFKNRLESIENLPTLPVIVEKLGAALRDPETEAGHVAEIIEDDPAIMARILKVVNSSFYFGAQSPTSLQSAIVRLGFQAVSNIALSVAIFSTFPPNRKSAFNRGEFWRHCICTGIAVEIISRRVGTTALEIGRDVLHLSGLLHDIGKIIFEQHFQDQFSEARDISRKEQVPLAMAEIRVFGVDHAQAGAWLAKKWNLSEPIIEVIRWHHNPDNAASAYRDLVVTCCLGDMIINTSSMGNSGNSINGNSEKIKEKFDLDDENLLGILSMVEEEAAESPLLKLVAT